MWQTARGTNGSSGACGDDGIGNRAARRGAGRASGRTRVAAASAVGAGAIALSLVAGTVPADAAPAAPAPAKVTPARPAPKPAPQAVRKPAAEPTKVPAPAATTNDRVKTVRSAGKLECVVPIPAIKRIITTRSEDGVAPRRARDHIIASSTIDSVNAGQRD